MSKQAISVTLHPDNLLWLRGQARARRRRSLSETLDHLIADARAGGRSQNRVVRSVVGTIRIAAADPGLSSADAVIRTLFPSASGDARTRMPAKRVRRRAKRARG